MHGAPNFLKSIEIILSFHSLWNFKAFKIELDSESGISLGCIRTEREGELWSRHLDSRIFNMDSHYLGLVYSNANPVRPRCIRDFLPC